MRFIPLQRGASCAFMTGEAVKSRRHARVACTPAVLHASPCRAGRSGRFRQPDPLFIRRAIGFVAAGRRQLRAGACWRLQGFPRARRDVRYLCQAPASAPPWWPALRKIIRPKISSAARMRFLSGARSFRRPTWPRFALLDHKAPLIVRSPIITAPTAASKTAGAHSQRSQPISRPIVLS